MHPFSVGISSATAHLSKCAQPVGWRRILLHSMTPLKGECSLACCCPASPAGRSLIRLLPRHRCQVGLRVSLASDL